MKVPEMLKEIAESEPGEWQLIELPHEDKDVYRYSFNTEFRIEHHEPWGKTRSTMPIGLKIFSETPDSTLITSIIRTHLSKS